VRPSLLLLLLLTGCGTTARWHAGVTPADDDVAAVTSGRPTAEIEVFFKPELDGADEGGEEPFVCATTTLLRRGFLLEETVALPVDGREWQVRGFVLEQGVTPPPDRDAQVLGWVTTEEFPRDDRTSVIVTDEVSNVFGIGDDVTDTFVMQLDPTFREAALQRLREWAATLGADAVIDVFATGEAEYHMWHGTVLSFDVQSPHSPLYSGVQLLGLQLRDVRLHGTAIRYED
jgi:hypothetical protein